MKDKEELRYFIRECEPTHDTWRKESEDWLDMYRGDQWDADDKSRLEDEERPAVLMVYEQPDVYHKKRNAHRGFRCYITV